MQNAFRKENLKEILEKVSCNFFPNDNYISSYRYILQASDLLLSELGPDAVPSICFMAYGWMPTILSYDSSSFYNQKIAKSLEISNIEEAKNFIDSFERSPVNNSWVGLSKTLHFINPNIFPIWDSRVALHFGVSNSYQMAKKQNYLRYLEFVHANLDLPEVTVVRMKIRTQYRYEMTPVRLIEYALFSNPSA